MQTLYKYKDKHLMNKKSYGCFGSHYAPKAQTKLLDEGLNPHS